MSELTATIAALPHALPSCPNARIALYALRRMGAHGLHDANATHALFTAFGEDFRRPLVLMRALMNELASTAADTIAIAPCCCGRITAAERALLTVLTRVEAAPDTARWLLSDLLGVRRVNGVLASVAAVATAFADDGRPICA